MPVWAQSVEGYSVTRYTDENGLPQNSVNAITKDSKGFLWFATEAGLVRFDGHTFFTFDKTILDIPGNRIRFFLPRVGTPGVREPWFYSFDGIKSFTGVFENSRPEKIDVFPDRRVRSALSNITKGGKLNYITSLPAVFSATDVDTLRSTYLGILPAGNNAYYFRHNGSIEYYVGGILRYRVYEPRNHDLLSFRGKLFAVQNDGNLLRIDQDGGHPVTLSGDILKDKSYGNPARKINYFWNNVSQQTFIHLDGSVYQVELSDKQASTRLLIRDMNLAQHGVIAIYMDEFQNIFLGSQTEGLFMLRKKKFNVVTVPEDSAKGVFYAIAPSSANSLITRQGYRIFLDGDSSQLKQSKAKLGHHWSWYFLAKDRDGNLWVSESSSPVDRRLSKYSSDGQKLLGCWDVPGAVNAVYCDPFGTTWFETNLGRLYYVSPDSKGQIYPVMLTQTHIGGINVFERSSERQMWLGSSNGLYVLDIKSKEIVKVPEFENLHVRDIYRTGGELWICTYGDGMYLYKDKRVTHFPLDDDKYLSSAHCIVEDHLGRFWIPTNKGLFVASRSDLLAYSAGKVRSVFYYYYDKSNGFNTNEFNGGCQPCGVKLQSGHIAFPSLNGIVYFDPRKQAIEFANKDVLIRAIMVDGKFAGRGKSVTVPRDFEQLQVLVSTPFFGNKKNVQLSYSASDRNPTTWFPIRDAGRIYLTGLSPGHHVLHIRKHNGFGKENFSYVTLQIIVEPYWYETKVFLAVAIVLLSLMIHFFLKARTAYLERKSYNENLLNNARLYGDIITAINHDIQTPMHYVIYSLEEITKYLYAQEESNAQLSRMGTEALGSLRRISTLTNNLLHYLKVNLYQNKYSITTSRLPLHPLIFEIVEMFSAKIARDNIRVVNLVPEKDEYMLNPQLFSVILHNLIDNAVKVSKNGTIILSIVSSGDKRKLLIQDSGKGMPTHVAAWLMDDTERTQRSNSENVNHKTSNTGGLGLIIVKDLCRLSGISLEVIADPYRGTSLYVTLASFEDQ